MSSLVSLKKQRGVIKARLTVFTKFLDELKESFAVNHLQVKLEHLSKQFEKVYDIHDKIIEVDEEENHDSHQAELEAMEENFYVLSARARTLIQAKEAKSATTSSQPSSTPVVTTIVSNSRLPEIRIPSFNGDLEDWRPFRDIYVSKIHGDDKISSVDKFYYLKSYVTGKAARSIEAIECTAKNYEAAWKILEDKYENSRKTILRHWAMLHDIPRLFKDTPGALEELTDTFRQHIRALESLGEPVEQFDSIFIFILCSKITEAMRFQWETTLEDNKMPKVDTLLDFLSKRGSCSEFPGRNSASERTKSNPHGPPRGKALFVKSDHQSDTCFVCQANHPVYKCTKFHSLSVSQRRQALTRAGACFNCLNLGHKSENCTRGSCRSCGGKHNTLVHRDKSDKQDQRKTHSSSGVAEVDVQRMDPSQ